MADREVLGERLGAWRLADRERAMPNGLGLDKKVSETEYPETARNPEVDAEVDAERAARPGRAGVPGCKTMSGGAVVATSDRISWFGAGERLY